MIIDTKPDCEDSEDIEQYYANESRLDRTRNRAVRFSRFTRCYCDEFDAAEGVECVYECLRECREPANECLTMLKVGAAGSWMILNTTPVINEPHKDENNDQEDFDECKPILRFTVDSYMDELEQEYRDNNYKSPMPHLQL